MCEKLLAVVLCSIEIAHCISEGLAIIFQIGDNHHVKWSRIEYRNGKLHALIAARGARRVERGAWSAAR